MSIDSPNLFEAFLNRHDDKAWSSVLSSLLPSIHEVDRNATQIWFSFYPLVLLRALQESDSPDQLARKLLLQGRYRLDEQIDSSHEFLYGHRYWPHVKEAVQQYAKAAPSSLSLVDQILDVAASVASKLGVDRSLVAGVTAVAFMTLEHVGLAALSASPGSVNIDPKHRAKSADKVLKERARERGQGLFGFLRTVNKAFTVTFDESRPECTFGVVAGQDLATAGASDTRDYKSADPRCVEGPVPVECRTAACGTCWVGMLGGAEKLSEVEDREWRKMKEFGYIDTDDPRPLIRLACRAKGFGSVSVVVPPWNGFFGRLLEEERSQDPEVATANTASPRA